MLLPSGPLDLLDSFLGAISQSCSMICGCSCLVETQVGSALGAVTVGLFRASLRESGRPLGWSFLGSQLAKPGE